MNKFIKPIFAGFLGSLFMATFYFLVLFLVSGDLTHPIGQFMEYKIWLSLLIIGFGVQAGLFWYVRTGMHLDKKASGSAMATGAGISTFSMVACCAHHIFDLLPILGLSAVSIFLVQYQEGLFAISVLINLLGIAFMLYIIKNKKCVSLKKMLNNLLKNKQMKNLLIIILAGGVLLVGAIFVFQNDGEVDLTSSKKIELAETTKDTEGQNSTALETLVDDQAKVKVEVTPKQIDTESDKMVFSVVLDTHSVDLSYDFKNIIELKDDVGNVYKAEEWTGNSGWHHVSGDIIFNQINKNTKKLTMTMEGIAGIDRSFEWELIN